jgi:hypothetical protein
VLFEINFDINNPEPVPPFDFEANFEILEKSLHLYPNQYL